MLRSPATWDQSRLATNVICYTAVSWHPKDTSVDTFREPLFKFAQTQKQTHTYTSNLLLFIEMEKLAPGQCLETDGAVDRAVRVELENFYMHTHRHEIPHKQTNSLLTVEPNIMVGQDSWLVAFGSSSDDHMQHPIWGFDVVFLKHKNTTSKNSLRKSGGFTFMRLTAILKNSSMYEFILYVMFLLHVS